MKKYLNKNENSGVSAYDLGPDFIRIQFVDGSIYRYTTLSVGSENLHKMASLAQGGQGLSTFISQVIKNKYAEKE